MINFAEMRKNIDLLYMVSKVIICSKAERTKG